MDKKQADKSQNIQWIAEEPFVVKAQKKWKMIATIDQSLYVACIKNNYNIDFHRGILPTK